jgi:hypothetical protein
MTFMFYDEAATHSGVQEIPPSIAEDFYLTWIRYLDQKKGGRTLGSGLTAVAQILSICIILSPPNPPKNETYDGQTT